jgi:uncharacterized Fe-S center protein
MGMASRPTKQVQHSSLKPHSIAEKCTGCGLCVEICPANAVSMKTGGGPHSISYIDPAICIGCGECLCACKFDAIAVNWSEDVHIFARRMVEVAGLILSKFKNTLFLNFAFDITKECDCISTRKEKIICGDIGILASRDIVSIDRATIDLINKGGDILQREGVKDSYKTMLNYSYKKGLGTVDYNLIEV